jgi:hypothetical protein
MSLDDPTDIGGVLPVQITPEPLRKDPRNNAATGASAAGVRAFTAQAIAFYFRAPVKAFFRTRVDYLVCATFQRMRIVTNLRRRHTPNPSTHEPSLASSHGTPRPPAYWRTQLELMAGASFLTRSSLRCLPMSLLVPFCTRRICRFWEHCMSHLHIRQNMSSRLLRQVRPSPQA